MKISQVYNNAKWIVFCKIAQSLLQLVIGMISARYLGPSNYGLISYAASIVAFFLPIMRLGLNATLVREFMETPEKEGEVAGTSMILNVLSSFFCIFGVFCVSMVANFGETETILVCVLYSTSILFAAVEMIQYWFQYKLMSKYSSLAMLAAYVLVSAYKIILLITKRSIYWFALSHSVEYGLIAVMLIALYIKHGSGKFSFSKARAREMLGRSKHYILSAMMVVIFQNTDHFMLKMISGNEENGYYSAAITCAGVVQFVYMAIVDSFRPLILSAKKENSTDYEKNISLLYGIVTYVSFIQSAVFTVFAWLLIGILYGGEYSAAIPVLQILTWYCAFSYMGTIRNIWLLAEEKQKYLPTINLSGVLFNIVFNAVLIPFFGACGAAFASLMTQIFTNLVLGFILKPLRENNKLLLKGCNPKFIFSEGRNIIKIIRKK